jgi:hypothetical protein
MHGLQVSDDGLKVLVITELGFVNHWRMRMRMMMRMMMVGRKD